MAIVQPSSRMPPGGWSAPTPQGVQFRVFIIWRKSGVKGGRPLAREYCTDDMLDTPTFKRGRPVDVVSVGNVQTGACNFTLLNLDGKYSQNNEASPLYVPTEHSYITVGGRVGIDVRAADNPGITSRMWSGILTNLSVDHSEPRLPTVSVSGQGFLWRFLDKQMKIDIKNPATTAGDLFRLSGKNALPTPMSWGSVHGEIGATKYEGSTIGLWSALETREASGPLIELKTMRLAALSETPRDASALFNDDGLDYVGVFGDNKSVASAVEELSNEAQIFTCFPYIVESASQEGDYPDDLAAPGGSALLGTWVAPAPTSLNGIWINDNYPRQTSFAVWTYEPTDDSVDFVSVRYDLARIRWKVVPSRSTRTNSDPADLGTPVWITRDDATGAASFNVRIVEINAEDPRWSVEWRLRRNALSVAPGTHNFWLQEVEFYGVRQYVPDESTSLKFCMAMPSSVADYGERDFPIELEFDTLTAAEEWTQIMAARYSNERVRLVVEVVPQTADEYIRLSGLDLFDRVQLELHGKSGMFLPPGTFGIIEQIATVNVDERVQAFRFDLVESGFYDDKFQPDGSDGT